MKKKKLSAKLKIYYVYRKFLINLNYIAQKGDERLINITVALINGCEDIIIIIACIDFLRE